MIIKELEQYAHKIISNYVKKNEILIENVTQISSDLKEILNKKFLFICLALFFNKRSAFFDLLRKDINKDEDILNFWDELNVTYD